MIGQAKGRIACTFWVFWGYFIYWDFIYLTTIIRGLPLCFAPATSLSSAETTMKLSSPTFRSNRPEVFCEKGVLRNFGKFTGKHLCQNLFLIKLQACEFSEISKNTFFYRTPPVAASVYSLLVIFNLAYGQLYHWQSLIVSHNLPILSFYNWFLIYLHFTINSIYVWKSLENKNWLFPIGKIGKT